MKKHHALFLVFVVLFLFCSSCYSGHSITNSSNIQSITPKESLTGKWLLTVSIGGAVPEDATLAMRNELVQVFSTEQGGLYEHTLDLDDYRPGHDVPTRENVFGAINRTIDKIADFKQTHPNAKTMVVFGLTGHGSTDNDGNFSLQLKNDTMSGKEIVDFIERLAVDETLLIMQSCESGSIVDHHFPDSSKQVMDGLKDDVVSEAEKRQINLSVVTPISRHASSPIFVWERDILARSFSENSADLNQDDIISYSEWKNFTRQVACQHPVYLPSNAFSSDHTIPIPDSGIDPLFFDPKMPSDLPFLLTPKGIQRYKEGTLVLPSILNDSVATFTSDTVRICTEAEELFETLHRSELDGVLDIIQTPPSPTSKIKAIHHLLSEYYLYSKHMVEVLLNEIDKNPNESIRGLSIRVLGEKGPREGYNTYFDQAIKIFVERFQGETPLVQSTIAKALGILEVKSATTLLINALNTHSNRDVRKEAAFSLGKMEDKAAISPLMKRLEEDSDEWVRASAAYSLGLLDAHEAESLLEKVKENDPSYMVRQNARVAILMIQES